jgi:hypothetical protein
MKKIIALGMVIGGVAIGAHAQGSVNLDNSSSTGSVCLTSGANFYSGPFTLQVWSLNGTTVPGNINSSANTVAYANLTVDGFAQYTGSTLQQTISGVNSGVFSLGAVTLSSVTSGASSAVLALVGWNGLQTTYAAAVAAGDKLGVYAFVNPVGNPLSTPPGTPAALSGFTGNLVLTSVPEPTTLALAGLGGAALLAFRRKKA